MRKNESWRIRYKATRSLVIGAGLTLADLPVGAKFEFSGPIEHYPYARLFPAGISRGPWQKVGIRKFASPDALDFRYSVASINVAVRRLG